MPCPCPCPLLSSPDLPDHSCSASAAWAAMQRCTENFTANPTFSSCLRAKATTMRALAGSSTRSSGHTRRWTPAPRQPEALLFSTPSVEGLEQSSGKGGKGMRPSCSGRRLQGQGSVPGFLHYPSVGGDLGTRIWGCPPSCFLLCSAHPTSPYGPLGGPQAQLPYLGAFSPARSQHASLRVLSSLTATWGLVWPPRLPIYLCP